MRISDLLETICSLTEGGHIFKDVNGNITTSNINKVDIDPTLRWLEKLTRLPLINNKLGSVGKKSVSGDIDVSIDETTISKDELISKLMPWISQQTGSPKDWVRKVGMSVNLKAPIRGNPKNGYVQIDMMFHRDPKWMKFSMYSAGDDSKFSGAVRNMTISSIAKSQGLKYSWQKGLVKREDDSLISIDPDVIAKRLFGPKQTGNVFDSVEDMQIALKQNPILIKKLQDLKITLLSDKIDGVIKRSAQIKTDQEEANRITAVIRTLI